MRKFVSRLWVDVKLFVNLAVNDNRTVRGDLKVLKPKALT